MSEIKETEEMRPVRPWLAGALSIVSWGLGLYYAGKTRAAIRLAIGQLVISLAVGIAMIAALLHLAPASAANTKFSIEIASVAMTVSVAAAVAFYAAKKARTARIIGPRRLLGYPLIMAIPVLGGIVAGLIIRSFFFQVFELPAGSMKPTTSVGDVVIVSKRAYGYSRASYSPFTRLLPPGRIFAREPRRGDLVIFKNAQDGNSDYFKRLVGMPGDIMEMRQGRLFINDKAVKKDFVGIASGACHAGGDAAQYRETLDNGRSYLVQECAGDNGFLDDIGPYRVPENHFFMMGDNRDESQDSRVTTAVGFIPFDAIVGRVELHNEPTVH